MLSHDINLESAHFLLNCFASVDCCPCSAAPNACRALFKQEGKWSIYQKWNMCPRPWEVPSRWLGCLREEDRGTTSLACQVQAVPPPLLSLSAESHSWNLRREKSFSVSQLGELEVKLSLSPNLKQKSRLKTFLGAVCRCSYRSTWLRSWGLDFYPLRYLLHAEIPSSCIHPGGIC